MKQIYLDTMKILRIAIGIVLVLTCIQLHAQESSTNTVCVGHAQRAESFYNEQLYGQARMEAKQYLDHEGCRSYNDTHLARTTSIYLQAALQLDLPQALNEAKQYIQLQYPNPYIHDLIIETADYLFNEQDYESAIFYYNMVDLDRITEERLAQIALNKGYAHFISRDFKEAMYSFAYAKDKRTPLFDEINYYYAMSKYFTEDLDGAVKVFKRIEKSPRYQEYIPYYIAQIYYKERQYSDLLAYGERVLKEDRLAKKAEIHLLVGKVYFENKEYTKALSHLEYYENNSESLTKEEFYQLAFSQYSLGQYTAAKRNFLELTVLDSKMGQIATYYLADCYYRLGDLISARAAFKKVSQMKYVRSMQEEAAFNYGKLSIEAGYNREALAILSAVRSNSPYYRESKTLINDILQSTEDYQYVCNTIESMVEVTPELQLTYQRAALNQALIGIKDNAPEKMGWLNKSLTYQSDPALTAQTYFWQGRLAQLAADPKSSMTSFQQYFNIVGSGMKMPEASSLDLAYYYQAYNNFDQQDYKEARIGFEKALPALKDRAKSNRAIQTLLEDAQIRLADCYLKEGKYAKAKKTYAKIINRKHAEADYALYQTSIINSVGTNPTEQIFSLEKIRDQYPNSPYMDDALLALGDAYVALDRAEPAEINYMKLINDYSDQSPLVNPALLNLGLLYYNQGKTDEALAVYKKLMKHNPSPEQSKIALNAIEEIFVNDKGSSKGYVDYVESLPGMDISRYTQDSLAYRAAHAQLRLGNYDVVISLANEHLNDNPLSSFSIPITFTRAEAYMAKKQYENALADYQKIVAMGVNDFYEKSLQKAALIAYNQTQDFRTAYNLNNTLVNFTQDIPLRKIARIYALKSAFRTKNNTGVQKHAGLIIRDQSSSKEDLIEAYYYKGKVAYQLSNKDEAYESFSYIESHGEQNNLWAEVKHMIARIQYERKNLSDALRLLQEANSKSTRYPKWIARNLLLMSDVYIEQKDLLNARAAVEAVIENFKNDLTITEEANQKLKMISSKEQAESRIKSDGNSDNLEMDNNEK